MILQAGRLIGGEDRVVVTKAVGHEIELIVCWVHGLVQTEIKSTRHMDSADMMSAKHVLFTEP